jgi:magnesium chelatase family protein
MQSRFGEGATNARVADALVRKSVVRDAAMRRLLAELMRRHRLSARAMRRMERVALTIADLEGASGVSEPHILEALSYRLVDGARAALAAGA